MEQHYGLSPRGGKPGTRAKAASQFQTSDLGRHVKAISASHDDLTRLDRYQPIIIQNFELLTPSQLKFRRRSLSTANLYLSQASLTRSGHEHRPSPMEHDRVLPNAPLYIDHMGRIIGSGGDQTRNNDIQHSSSSSSSSSSSNQRGPDKPKRVTFSANNTTYPYDPEHQSPRSNPKLNTRKFRPSSDFIYPSKYQVSRQFQPFHEHYAPQNDNNNNIKNNNDNKYNNEDNDNNNNNDYNGQWIPQDSLTLSKDNTFSNGDKPRLPQRSALKKKNNSNSEEVRQVNNSSFIDHWPQSQINGLGQQSNKHGIDHTQSDKVAKGISDDGYNSILESYIDTSQHSRDTQGDDGEIIDSARVNGDTSINPNGRNTDIELEINTKYIDSSIAQDGNFDDKVNSEIDGNINNGDDTDINNGDTSDRRELVSPPLNDKLCNHVDTVSNIDSSTPMEHSIDNDCSKPALATSFIDVFSTYDIPDNEYNNSNINVPHKREKPRHSETSELIQNDNKATQTSTHPNPSSTAPPDPASGSSNPKVIRLKFLADSETTPDNKLKTTVIKLDDRYNELTTNRKSSNSFPSNDLTLLSSRGGQSQTTRQIKSASVSRQLKTKSTIEAVDLSTLAVTPKERPKSQGDMNAKFLMSMYSVSGDRKTDEERDLEISTTCDPETPPARPPSRKPTDRRVSFSANEYNSEHVKFRDPLSASGRGRQKERQLLTSSSKRRPSSQGYSASTPLLKHRSSSAHSNIMVTGNRMGGKERVVAAEKFLLKTGRPQSFDRTALNRQLEQLIVSRSLSSRVRHTMERSRSTLQ